MQNFLTNDPNVGWREQIPEIATSDPVLGGPGGPVNVPHQLLADRTNYLKANMGLLSDKVDALDLTVENILANGAGGGNGDGGNGGGGSGDGDGGDGGGDGTGGGTSGPEPGTIVRRDAHGRAQVAAPVDADDIANKAYVDSRVPGVCVVSVVGV